VKVILRREVAGLGQAGEIKDVADGYARNYLIPRGFAIAATAGSLANAEARQAAQRRQSDKEDEERRALAKQLEGKRVSMQARAGARGRLHGSITATQIAEALTASTGRPIDRHEIDLADPIRTVGDHQVTVKLARNAVAKVTIVVEAQAEA
jgi:large subunit ribosomal protein L9